MDRRSYLHQNAKYDGQLNDKGEIVGKNLTKTPEASAWFRSIYVDKNVAGGTWKLKLENTSEHELEAVIATWKEAVK